MSTRLSPRTIFLVVADVFIIYNGVLLALAIRLGWDGAVYELNERLGWLKVALSTCICLVSLYFHDLYDYLVINNRRDLVWRMVQALGVAWVGLAVLYYFLPALELGRGTALYAVLITLVALIALRSGIHFLLGHPNFAEKILIIGYGPAVADLAKAIMDRRDAGYRIVGFLSQESRNGHLPGVKKLGSIGDLEGVVQSERIDRIVIGVKERRGVFPAEELLRLRLKGEVDIEECASFYERVSGRVHLDMIRPSWLIFSDHSRATQLRSTVRDAMHRFLALAGFILSTPLALITAAVVRLDSPGPIFYRQERVGKNGRTFELIKFRSMRVDAESVGDPQWAAVDDERMTRVGKFIRKTRIDEIPQFWNILKGEMNFVGPRPERPHFVALLADQIPYYEHRHLVKPGLTGWAQIKYPYGSSIEDAKQKLQFDLYYIKNQNLMLDLMIVFETVKIIIFGRGAR